jgi:hypothetical protein
MRKSISALVAMAAMSMAVPASAATLYTNALLSGPIAAPGSVNFNANSPIVQNGVLAFNLDGFLSLDGVNSYEDDFELVINGSQRLFLSYDLGGGGSNVIFNDPDGATITGGTFGFFLGGQLNISIPVALLSGANSFVFNYTIPGPANGTGQGTGDEAWGISDVSLTADVAAVPEPASWALMLAGFGIVGAAARRRSNVRVSFS